MNAKRCKELRSNLRQRGIDPRDARYIVPSNRWYQTLVGTLVPDIGRAVYKAAKKAGAV